jgi:hypothetical protein
MAPTFPTASGRLTTFKPGTASKESEHENHRRFSCDNFFFVSDRAQAQPSSEFPNCTVRIFRPSRRSFDQSAIEIIQILRNAVAYVRRYRSTGINMASSALTSIARRFIRPWQN